MNEQPSQIHTPTSNNSMGDNPTPQADPLSNNPIFLEQYKLYVKMLESSNKHRMDTNTLFISINAVMVTFSSFFNKGNPQAPILVAVSGILFSIAWIILLVRHNKVNQARWNVIYEMEHHLPFNPFEREWKDPDKLGQEENSQSGKGKKKFYFPISLTEAWLPVGFMVIYVYIIQTGGFTSGVANLSDVVAELQDAVSKLTAALAEITRAGIGG